MPKNPDFGGWATVNNLRCADGLTIMPGAFDGQDGKKVPLVWNHKHDSPSTVIGHGILESRDKGVYIHGYLNNTKGGRDAKETLAHNDIDSLSIWADNLDRRGSDIFHGIIREVSLVLAGANPGAFIESVLAHGISMDDEDTEAIIFTGESIHIEHAAEEEPPKSKEKEESGDKTVVEVFNTLNEEQKKAVAIVVGQAIEDAKRNNNEEEEDDTVRHNLFEGKDQEGGEKTYLSHSDMEQIFKDARQMGSLRAAVEANVDGGVLVHSIDTTGMTTATGTQNYGVNDVEMLFPDYKSLNTPPEFISREMGWVSKVMAQVHRTPFSRIKSMYANITEDEARARGYIKGKQKKTEVFTTLKRTTDPQTVYKKQKLDRDDILDITDFDVVAWIKGEMRVMLNEEIARAILIGDGRPSDSEDKIQENHIRPVVSDVPLFNVIVKVTVPSDAGPEIIAKATINAIIRARKKYKGSGSPTFWTTEDVLTEMLLLEDGIGHKLYKTEAEISTALRVREAVTVEPMEGQKVKIGTKEYPLIGTIVNLADYNVGADRGADADNMFEDFDIDYNQMKYLIEKRQSGALIKPFSALTIVLDKSETTKPEEPETTKPEEPEEE